MSDFPPEIVNGLVQYLYTGDYASGKAKEASASKLDEDVLAELLSHIQFHHIASRYKIEKMAILSASNLKGLLRKYQDNDSLVTALPSAAEMAHSLAAGHDVQNAVAASFTRHLDKFVHDGKISEFHNMPDFFELVLAHCARRVACRKDAATELNKGLQVVNEKSLQRSAKLEEAIQLIRDRRRCINSDCRSIFNAEVTDTHEVTCRLCYQKQKLNPVPPGRAVTPAAALNGNAVSFVPSQASNPFQNSAATPAATQTNNLAQMRMVKEFFSSPAPDIGRTLAAALESKPAPAAATNPFAAPAQASSPVLGRKTGGGGGRGRGRGRGKGWCEPPSLNYG